MSGSFRRVTAAEAEEADLVVCGNVSHYDDDEAGTCADCGAPIVFRPYMPKRPTKVCIRCATARLDEEVRI